MKIIESDDIAVLLECGHVQPAYKYWGDKALQPRRCGACRGERGGNWMKIRGVSNDSFASLSAYHRWYASVLRKAAIESDHAAEKSDHATHLPHTDAKMA